MAYDSEKDTREHIAKVGEYLGVIFHEIGRRAQSHDASKLIDPEKSTFDKVTPQLKGSTYGSDEYKEFLADMKPALEHHYSHNRHHPEHHKDGVYGMTLVDIIEMFCDWAAATHRHEDGNIGKSIDINKRRFIFDEDLACIFVNTAQTQQMGRRNNVGYRKSQVDMNSFCKATP